MVESFTLGLTGFDVKVARLRACIPQWRLAQELGLRPGVLSEIENGRRSLSPAQLSGIMEVIASMEAARGW